MNFKKLRLHHNKTQDEISDILGLTRAGYGYIESGKREANYKSLNLLADYYGVSIDYLLGRSSDNGDKTTETELVKAEAIKLLEQMLNSINDK